MQTTSSPQSHTDWSTEHDAESAILEAADYDWCYAQAVVQARNDDDDTTIPTSNTAQHDLKNVTQHANFVYFEQHAIWYVLQLTAETQQVESRSYSTIGPVLQTVVSLSIPSSSSSQSAVATANYLLQSTTASALCPTIQSRTAKYI